jgi:hypothetical protein
MATKAGLDKLTFDMAHDLEPYGVVSIWTGSTARETRKVVSFQASEWDKILKAPETP